MAEHCYTLINAPEDQEPPTEQELRNDLENGKNPVRIEAMKKVITLIMAGERFPGLLMVIIRFVMPQDDKMLKKLLLIYWEIVPKHGQDGKLLHEMILVCDAYRKDLQHPNEFVRGCTLRFLCKLKEPDLLEPLMPAIQQALADKHQYVRRNAVLCILTIFKSNEDLIPDAPELIFNFLEQEQDASCKRNAFIMLIAVDQARALDYLATCIEQVQTFNNILQLVIIELVHKVCRTDPKLRSRFIRCIYNLLDAEASAVRYDAATTLMTLSSAPSAIEAAAKCFISLIMKESDNNVKLIVLDRLIDIKRNPTYVRILQSLLMDILQVLAAPDLEVRKKTLDLVLDLISTRNVDDVVQYLKKEITKTNTGDFDKAAEYRKLLIRTLHTCGVKFPDTAKTIVPQLMEFLSDESTNASVDVVLFVREAFERLPDMRAEMLSKLFDSFNSLTTAEVLRAVLWIFGEYASDKNTIDNTLDIVSKSLGELPLVDSELRAIAKIEEAEEADDEPKLVTRTRITADGTYATESAYTSVAKVQYERPNIRQILLDGNFFIATSLASAVTKMALRYSSLDNASAAEKNSCCAKCMLFLSSILHLGKSGLPSNAIDNDCYDRIMSCLRALAEPSGEVRNVFIESCHRTFAKMIGDKAIAEESTVKINKKTVDVHADELITFRALQSSEDSNQGEDFDSIISKATGADDNQAHQSKLNKVFQLSGFSDPVYAEAYVHVHQYDILLDVIIVNQTPDTLQNLTLELATLGDLKLTEKTSSHTLAPHDFANIKANVKVSSTETGIIFGNIVYDVAGASLDRNVVVLNDIHIDIMDYISPAYCTDMQFRDMWSEFEWENKVAVRTSIDSLRGYLEHLLKTTNMRCLTPESALDGDCDFLAANLYARSVFGEDALANLSIDKTNGKVSGHIRIRSKTQGIALSLGDKITLHQKEGNKSS